MPLQWYKNALPTQVIGICYPPIDLVWHGRTARAEAGRLGIDVSNQRFTEDTAALLQQVIAADLVALLIIQRFTSVRVHDSTSIGLPDALTSTWRGCGDSTKDGICFLAVVERLAATIWRWAKTNKRKKTATTAQRLRALTVPGQPA